MIESRATAVQALIEQLKALTPHWTTEGNYLVPIPLDVQQTYREFGWCRWKDVRTIANELAALLLREGPPQEPTEVTESSADWQPIEDVLEGPREIIGYNGDGAAGLREGQEPPVDTSAFIERAVLERFCIRQREEFKDEYEDDLGHSKFWDAMNELEDIVMLSNATVDVSGLREGPPAPQPGCPECGWNDVHSPQCRHAGQQAPPSDITAPPGPAGDVPQEAMPGHCENCRAEMPVTTVHLCHACLPSAPRDHAGDVPATEPARHVVEFGIEVAQWSPCQSKRGVVIFSGNDILGHGYNYKPRGFDCDGSAACKATCRTEAIHAEQQALLSVGNKATGAEMLHVKTVNGVLVASGGPSCVQCSKLVAACGVAGFWLYQQDGWRRYETAEFHQLSLAASQAGTAPRETETAIERARAAVGKLRDATREGLVIGFRQRDELVMSIHNALDIVSAHGAVPPQE